MNLYTILHKDEVYERDILPDQIGYVVAKLLDARLHKVGHYTDVRPRYCKNACHLIYAGRYVEPLEMAIVLGDIEIQARNWKGKRLPGYDRVIMVEQQPTYDHDYIKSLYYIDIVQKYIARNRGIVC